MNKLLDTLIENIGPGQMPSTAYDTAWVARLVDLEPTLGNQALNWLDSNQLWDGSWGALEPINYYDRVISSLAAMISLTKYGRGAHNQKQVEKGLKALEKIISTTEGFNDPTKVTIAFEMIIPTLLAEAEKLGIIKQHGESILNRLSELRTVKLSRIKGNLINRNTTMAFSAEMAGSDGQHMLDAENLQESNGSVGHSPSATAYFSLYVKQQDKRALEYLYKTAQKDGGAPNVAPFDTFEISWSLWNLHLIPGFEITPKIKSLLDGLANTWQPNYGMGFAAGYSVKDSDMTSLVFDTLLRYGYTKDVESVLTYEELSHFRCYPLEANPSVSANIHVLGALRQAGFELSYPAVQKVIQFLVQSKGTSPFWLDKWHSSPYYTTSHAIIASAGYANDLIAGSVDWILSTQQRNGAWGTYMPTAEETAYAIQALCIWNQNGSKINPSVIRRGIEWLEEYSNTPSYPPLWIGKCLYSPNLVIRSAIVSALTLGKQND